MKERERHLHTQTYRDSKGALVVSKVNFCCEYIPGVERVPEILLSTPSSSVLQYIIEFIRNITYMYNVYCIS